jgi:hypothetical protein
MVPDKATLAALKRLRDALSSPRSGAGGYAWSVEK